MILPSKHIAADRALLTLGARILAGLHQPATVSTLWDRYRHAIPEFAPESSHNYVEFVLTLDLLFMIGAIEFHRGLIHKVNA